MKTYLWLNVRKYAKNYINKYIYIFLSLYNKWINGGMKILSELFYIM